MPHKNPEDRKRGLRLYYETHKDEITKRRKARLATPEGRAKVRAYEAEYRKTKKQGIARIRKKMYESKRAFQHQLLLNLSTLNDSIDKLVALILFMRRS